MVSRTRAQRLVRVGGATATPPTPDTRRQGLRLDCDYIAMSRAFIERSTYATTVTGGTATAASPGARDRAADDHRGEHRAINGKIGASAAPIGAKTKPSAASGFIQTFGSSFSGRPGIEFDPASPPCRRRSPASE